MGVFEKYVEKLECAECGCNHRLRLICGSDGKNVWICEPCSEDKGDLQFNQPRVIHIDQKHKVVVINEVPGYEKGDFLYPSEPKGAA